MRKEERITGGEGAVAVLLRQRLQEKKYRNEKEKLENRIYRILFEEQNLTREETERYIFPFEQSGYLTAEQKLELLLAAKEQEAERGMAEKLIKELSNGSKKTITEEKITELYLRWRREEKCFFSWEEKKSILVCRMAGQLRDGVVGMLMRIGGDAIELGSCVATKTKKENKEQIGIRNGDDTLCFPFLNFSSEEELERIIRNLVTKERRGEITSQTPEWRYERPDGTRLYAVRPPVSPHWGFRMEFKKEDEKS